MLAEVRAYDGVQDRRSAVAQAAIVKFAATDWREYGMSLECAGTGVEQSWLSGLA
jgi:hypothetical protein